MPFPALKMAQIMKNANAQKENLEMLVINHAPLTIMLNILRSIQPMMDVNVQIL
jgi:hypothetical protein